MLRQRLSSENGEIDICLADVTRNSEGKLGDHAGLLLVGGMMMD